MDYDPGFYYYTRSQETEGHLQTKEYTLTLLKAVS